MAKTLVIKQADFSDNALDTVSFVSVPCTGLSFGSATQSLTVIGQQVELSVTVTPANTTDVLSFTSSDEDVAIVVNGVLKSVGIGTCTITATCGEQTATCTVTSTAAADFVTVGRFYFERQSSLYRTAQVYTNEPGFVMICRNDSNGLVIGGLSSGNLPTIENVTPCPMLIPKGTKTIRITSSTYSFRAYYAFFNSQLKEQQHNYGASLTKCVQYRYSGMVPGTAAKTLDIPFDDVSALGSTLDVNASGTDSIAIHLYSSEWPTAWATTQLVTGLGISVEFLTT